MFKKLGDKLFYRGGFFHPTRGLKLNWENDFKQAVKEHKLILNIGAGQHDKTGTISIDPAYDTEDATHLKALGEDLPYPDNNVDMVVCGAVLEHVQSPAKIVKEIHRVLKVGGTMYVDIPFLYPFHKAPSDNNRLTQEGLDYLCRDFVKIESGMSMGTHSALAQIIVFYFQNLSGSPFLNKILKNAAKVAVSPLKYLDQVFPGTPILAGGFYFYGKKNK